MISETSINSAELLCILKGILHALEGKSLKQPISFTSGFLDQSMTGIHQNCTAEQTLKNCNAKV